MTTAKHAKPTPRQADGPWPDGPLFAPMGGAWNGLVQQNARLALAGVEGVANAFKTWRQLIDASTQALRRQQDLAFEMMRTQLANAVEAHPLEAGEVGETPSFFAPMVAAAQAYEKVGAAVLQAQRGAFDALSASDASH